MPEASPAYVIGYVPGVTRATGLRSRGGKDLLQRWLVKFAERWNKPGAVDMATRYPDQFAYLLTQHHRATIFMFVDGTLTVYGKNPRAALPKQVTAALIGAGVTNRTPVAWYSDPESEDVQEVSAKQVIGGLPLDMDDNLAVEPPPASAFESVVTEIVDELFST